MAPRQRRRGSPPWPAAVRAAWGAAALCTLWAAAAQRRPARCFTAGTRAEGPEASRGASGKAAATATAAAASAAMPGGPRWIRPQSVARFAEQPNVQDEPDIPKELARMWKNTVLPDDEPREFSVAQTITPYDRWFGRDKQMIENRAYDDPFVDSTDETSYATVFLEKPMGIDFVENPPGEGGGAMILAVKPGSTAYHTGMLAPGAHLIAVDDKPVYGLPFDDVLAPIIEKEGPSKLTFFLGDALYFYGEFRPSVVWLSDFIERLKEQGSPASEQDADADADDAQ